MTKYELQNIKSNIKIKIYYIVFLTTCKSFSTGKFSKDVRPTLSIDKSNKDLNFSKVCFWSSVIFSILRKSPRFKL